MESTNNLKQIGLAIHAYHDVNKHLPTNILGKDGKPLLSWRVHILPYIEQDNLYRQFKLDEAWDSPHNKQLIDKMSPVFRNPQSRAKPGHTTYLAPAGKDLFLSGTALKLQEFKDGTSNTILIVDADDAVAVPWTKPDDLPIDPKQPLKGLGSNPTKTFNALFGDGSVRTISRSIDPAGFYGMLTVSGGEVIPPH
jgi:hypothetical protein